MTRNPSLKQRLDKETLERLYLYEGLSVMQIAQRYNSYSENVQALLDEYRVVPGTARR